jgi:hypothetical protein
MKVPKPHIGLLESAVKVVPSAKSCQEVSFCPGRQELKGEFGNANWSQFIWRLIVFI